MRTVHSLSKSERAKPPKPEELTLHFSEKAIKELETIITHYPEKKAAILPALWIAQREYGGFLPPEAIAEVAFRLNRSYAEIEGVATFYTMYHVGHKLGKHLIEVCTCLTCAVCGAYRIADYLKEKLGIDWGDTTPDGLFTLEEVECLDACDRAPVLQVGTEYYGPVDKDAIDKLIEDLKAKEESTVIELADTLVSLHFRKNEVSGS
ncbi:MAG TPA: NAD(P)H-dependent oxidoreductase subunit E [Fimbriimonadales bacterium]|nr:NAD(P)H-dependent oxidoreductase subunit E [Fimbriimonadales bacterium]